MALGGGTLLISREEFERARDKIVGSIAGVTTYSACRLISMPCWPAPSSWLMST